MPKPVSVARSSSLVAAGALMLGLFTATAGAPAASGATPSGTPLAFGVISTDTGASGLGTVIPTTVKNWAKYVNSHGGIKGHPVKIDYFDDGGSESTAIQDATTLIQNDHVVAIGDASQTQTSFAQVAAAAHVPIISLGAGSFSPDYLKDSNAFPTESGVTTLFWAMAKDAQLSGGKNLGLLYCSEVAACAQLVPAVTSHTASLGVKVAYSAAYSASTPNYTAVCLAAKGTGTNSMVVAGPEVAANDRLLDNCAQQGYHPIAILGGNSFDPQAVLHDSNIPVVYGYTGTLPWFVHDSATTTIDKVMGSYLKTAPTPNLVFDSWSGLELLAAAAGHVPSSATPTTQDIYNGLYALHGTTLGGLTIPLTFQKGTPSAFNCMYFLKAMHGKLTINLNGKPGCNSPAVS